MTTQTDEPLDIVDRLAGIAPQSALDSVRRSRPETRAQIQASYDALFNPVDDAEVSLAERWLVAAFATALARASETARHYSVSAHEADATAATTVLALAAAEARSGPYGAYAEPGLQGENIEGPVLRIGDERAALGERLSAAIEHTHLLVLRPRESSAGALAALLDAGWSVDGIVTLSQLVAFLAFQQRVVAGLRVLDGRTAA